MARPFKLFPSLRSVLRRFWMRTPYRSNIIKESRVEVVGKRYKYVVPCAECKKELRLNEVKVDHKIPCGSLTSFSDVGGFVERLFCDIDGLQCLCKQCHDIKTILERKKK